jgi:hypothetical protein
MILFIDDVRELPEQLQGKPDVVIARTFADAICQIMTHRATIAEIWFDHDLGDANDHNNGYTLACMVESFAYEGTLNPAVLLYCHSDNPPGRAKILTTIQMIYRRLNAR